MILRENSISKSEQNLGNRINFHFLLFNQLKFALLFLLKFKRCCNKTFWTSNLKILVYAFRNPKLDEHER